MTNLRSRLRACALLALAVPAAAQTQHAVFAGLRSVHQQGAILGVASNIAGELYLLLDEQDGVRVLKTDANAGPVIAQVRIGASGDHGVALALDPSGNVFVTGTSTSTTLGGTSGAAFPMPSDATTNTFVAAFNPDLSTRFITFTGSGRTAASAIAVTADAVFVTGSIFTPNALPVTLNAIGQSAAGGSSQNGFVERFSPDGSTLVYATYLSGRNGDTAPSSLAVDGSDNVYVAGYTTSTGYPAVAALIPAMLSAGSSPGSGFLTKLTPAGDGLAFSTFIPGTGVSSLAFDSSDQQLLLTGNIAFGEFPVTSVAMPLAAMAYQTLVRLPLDGSSVFSSTVLAPSSSSTVAAGPSGTAWVSGALTTPLLPLATLQGFGDSFAERISGIVSATRIDQAARFGGLAVEDPGYASGTSTLAALAVDASGSPVFAGSFMPSASASLLASETYDLPLTSPSAALPSPVTDAVPLPAACGSGTCSGSAEFLLRLSAADSASLELSTGDHPNLILRNLGSATATNLQITSTSSSLTSTCGTSLTPAAECIILLDGAGGILNVAASNAASQSFTLAATSNPAEPLTFTPHELDFGIQTASSAATTRTLTVTNLSSQPQTFTSALSASARTALPYTFAETGSDCAGNGAPATKVIAASGSCHITIGFTASASSANDAAVTQNWIIGNRNVRLTGFTQAAAIQLSTSLVEFGTQYAGGLRTPRNLYLSNNSSSPISHAPVTLPSGSAFTLLDACPAAIAAHTVCGMELQYNSTRVPSDDAVTIALDQGLSVTVTGKTLPQPGTTGSAANPYLSLSTTSIHFATTVPVTSVSASTQSVMVTNTGTQAFAFSATISGDFAQTGNCPATLAGGASCSIAIAFTPSQPGTRAGLLTISAGAGTTPSYVSLSGTASAITSASGTVAFGSVLVGEPSVQWFKISQPFTSLSGSTANSAFALIVVEDYGYGHGQPSPGAFGATATGSCSNCWLGVQFRPQTTGTLVGTLLLTTASAGLPFALNLAGTGLPLTGVLLSPGNEDFGTLAAGSVSGPVAFTVTNLLQPAALVSVSGITTTGPFNVTATSTGAATCTGTLAPGASCVVTVVFAPVSPGTSTGTLTIASSAGSVAASLSGYATANPGITANPASLTFSNVPGTTSTTQTIVLTNTGASPLQLGAPVPSTAAFAVAGACPDLAAGASCTLTVGYVPGTAPASDTLRILYTDTITGSAGTLTVTLAGTYTAEDAGLQIVPGVTDFGPSATMGPGETRQFTINNLTAKTAVLTLTLPRQFALASPACAAVQPHGSCTFNVTSVPLTNGAITGTLFAQAAPTDGSAPLQGLAYLEAYGEGPGSMLISGLSTGLVRFGAVASGQTAQQTLTLTNASSFVPLTVRRVLTEPPFSAISTCGGTLTPSATCTVTITYSPLNQVATGAASAPATSDSGTLILESDSASGPDVIELAGSGTAVATAAPSNQPQILALTASESSLTFPATTSGNVSPAQTVTLVNTGNGTVSIGMIQTSADYTVTQTCGTLVPGAGCAVSIAFTPQPVTAANTAVINALEISSSAATSLDFLSLNGVANPASLTLSPTALTFPTTLVGQSTSLPIVVSNAAASSVTLSSLVLTGDFTLSAGTCPAPPSLLAGNSSCTLMIAFHPAAAGIRAGTISLTNSATSLPLTAVFSGIAVQAHLLASPNALTFSSTAVGASSTQTLTLTNTGTTPVSNVVVSTVGGSDYQVTHGCAVTTLPAGATCVITITFAPTASGARSGVLTVTSSDPSSPLQVSLTGSGAVPPSYLFTVNGGTSATVTLRSGSQATYPLLLTAQNSFTGMVALTCAPVTPVVYGACSLLPSTVALTATSGTSTATISTLQSIATNTPVPEPFGSRAPVLFFALLIPAAVIRRRRLSRLVLCLSGLLAMAGTIGCGGGSSAPNIRYTPAGSYRYTVTATSGSLSQTVTLDLVVQ